MKGHAIIALLVLAARTSYAAPAEPPLTLPPPAPPDPSDVPAPLFDAAATAPANLSAMRLTLYWDNDGGWAKPFDRHDRHYTSGQGASLALRAPVVKEWLSHVPSIADEFAPGDSDYAMGFVGALTIYTPTNFGVTALQPDDRPFAGWTYGGFFFQRANRRRAIPIYESLELDVGMVGPSSLAQNAQELVHHTFDYVYPLGWRNQIHDEPEFAIKYNRKWLWEPLPPCGSFSAQLLPDVGLTTGSLMNEAHAGAMLRAGWNLEQDFGPGTLDQPADFTGGSSLGTGVGSWSDQTFYVFARPYGRLVAHNVLLQGDNWRFDDPVTFSPAPAVGGIQYGLTHRFLRCFEFTYLLTTQSREFRHQNGWDTWASVQFSFVYGW